MRFLSKQASDSRNILFKFLYEKIKQKIQFDTLDTQGNSSQRSGSEMIRSHKDGRMRNKRKRKRDPSQDYLNQGFGGFSYQDEMLNYGRNESSKKKMKVSSQEKIRREVSSISATRKVEKQMGNGTDGRVKHRARGKHRGNRLKLDKDLMDQEAVIRKSLQSEGYYRRHRQKARNNVSVPSSTSQSKTPKGGSIVRKKKKKKRLPAFQHIPLSFMNTATPKPKHNKSKERSSGKSTSTQNHNKYFVVDDAVSSPNFNHKDEHRDTNRSNSNLNKESSRLELDFYLVNGTMQSTLKSNTEHRESIEVSRKRKSRENQILRSYGNREYNKANKISHKRSMSKKDKSKKSGSRHNIDTTADGNSNLRLSMNKKKKFTRDSSEPGHHISESYSGLKKHSNFMKPTKSTKNFTLMRNTSHGNQKKARGAHYVRGSEKENHSDMIHLSPSLTHNSKISNSYSDYYKANNKSKMLKHMSKLIALDEAEEFYLQNNSELYKHIKKNNQNIDMSNIRKKKRTSSGTRKGNYNVDYSAGRQKYSKSKKENGLTLDLDSLDNPKMTHTHYPKSSTYLPPQHPSNMNFPNSTKNSKMKRHPRKTNDSSKSGVPLCLLSMNRPDEYNREKRKKSSRKSSNLKKSKKIDYDNYSNCAGQSYVELEDGTRNYNINEYQKSDSNERRKRRTRSKKKRKHKKGSSSYGGFGHFYEAYGEKSSSHHRDRDFEKKFKKMKMMASREVSHPKSIKSKDNLLSFGGAQWK